jgi:hypothetical protein
MESMSTNPPKLLPRCFYCDTVLSEKDARIAVPSGKVFGPCCSDVVSTGSTAYGG